MSDTPEPLPDDFPADAIEQAMEQLNEIVGENWVVSTTFVRTEPVSGAYATAVVTDTENPVLATALALAMVEDAVRATNGCDCETCAALRLGASQFRDAVLKAAVHGALH